MVRAFLTVAAEQSPLVQAWLLFIAIVISVLTVAIAVLVVELVLDRRRARQREQHVLDDAMRHVERRRELAATLHTPRSSRSGGSR